VSFRITRRSDATWQGSVSEGGGQIELGSGAFTGPFSLHTRTTEVERASNPEELIAAAEAACFTMSLANELTEAGRPPQGLRTTANLRLEQREDGFRITRIELQTVGEVQGISHEQFAELAAEAERNCPVSKALSGTEITLKATLAGT
jgi:lipoyl-dependent peroxiredoxin